MKKMANEKSKNKESVKTIVFNGDKVTIDPRVKSLENHPHFIRKTEEAKQFIAEYGLPEN